MVKLTKQFTRYEWPLFWCYVWDHSDRVGIKEWLGYGIDNILFVRSGTRDAVTVWYDKKEYDPDGDDKFDRAVTSSLKSSPNWVDKLLVEYNEVWKRLVPYVVESREIKNYQELKQYCDDWQRWWTLMSLVFSVPDAVSLSEKDRVRLLKARAKTQEYSEYGGEVIFQFLIKKNKVLARAWPFMSVEEVLLAGRGEVTDGWIARIVERQRGVGLLNGRLYAESELAQELEGRGLVLEGERDLDKVEAINGTIASPGIAKGVVKVVASYDDIDLVEGGQVLVTEMTMPSFLPAMKRAVAFITDEGGVTCHAAIIAREMKKPCIIGTKIATQVLKDGDMVEVDANKGVVRILK